MGRTETENSKIKMKLGTIILFILSFPFLMVVLEDTPLKTLVSSEAVFIIYEQKLRRSALRRIKQFRFTLAERDPSRRLESREQTFNASIQEPKLERSLPIFWKSFHLEGAMRPIKYNLRASRPSISSGQPTWTATSWRQVSRCAGRKFRRS
jgi:hypothetical protein